MIRTAVGLALTLPLALMPFTLAAQESSRSAPPPQVHLMPGGTAVFLSDLAETCPIGMHATQGMWDHTIRVREGEKQSARPQVGQRIALNLKDSHPIVSAVVRVRGLNGKNRMMLTPAGTEQDWNAVTIQNVRFGTEADGSVSADLRVPGFTAVHSVELISVSYADGSRWSRSSLQTCRTQPDPLMLITER
ncbi:hypothetical protein [Occallatibacter savannae]|uniref:hypothetical protein n=1 Tax=Occallatibacter savannae TaxID=1002691 RepID=UPI0013A59A35|nr:hypothetical protein [Occallatibacter savannae]